uniref:NAD-dependent epimerase/dehydratase domain-containing protein n=1 Tax=Salix viminalis TaxID=40686 RepID=A0A6N2KQR4_SALVM
MDAITGFCQTLRPRSLVIGDHQPPKLSTPKRTVSLLSLYKNQKSKTKLTLSSMTAPLQVSAFSTIGARNEESGTASSGLVGENDLLIVGPGVLGRLVAEKWRQEHPGCQVYGQTVTTDHHDELIKMGINPSLKGIKATQQYPYVIFCAPPSRTSDYPGDVREAALSWNGDGSFVFTSSSAPFDCFDNGQCNEDSPVVPIGRSPRTDVLLKAEKVVLESGGSDRGAHTYWLEKGTVESRPDHILNLIHYEDAASLAVAILKKKLRSRIFLGCDNHPLSRQEVMDLVAKSGKFSKKFVAFTGTSDPLGKRLNNSKTREEIGWEPKYPSFAHFLGVSK